MKQQLLIALLVLSTMDLFSQIDKGKIIISVNGNYTKSTSENGVLTNQTTVQGKYLNIGASFGYFLTDKFIAGFGLDYSWNKETRSNTLMINRFSQYEGIDLKSTAVLPNIYLGYYYQVINKLYFNTNLKLSYGKVKSEYNDLLVGDVHYPADTIISVTDQYSASYMFSKAGSTEVDFFSAQVLPELNYFVSQKISLCLGLGGIEYSMIDWKTDNSNCTINFSPAYWRFGIKIKL